MGSLPSPPRPTTPPPSPENSSSNDRVYTTFCCRKQVPNTNISNWIECCNPSNNTWSHVCSIPGLIYNHVLKGFAMVSIGDLIYIISGRLCHKEIAHVSDEDDDDDDDFVDMDLEVLSMVLCYNVRSNEWSECAQLSIPRYDFACSVSENKIYVAGGQSTLANARGVSSAEVYDPTRDIWNPLPNMGILRYKCAGVTWQGKFPVVGGFAEQEDSDLGPFLVKRSSAEVYDTQAERWYLKAGMWQLDVPPNQIAMVDGRLFNCGDCLNAWGHIDIYDGNIWNEVDGSQQALNSPISTFDANNENWQPNHRLYLTMAPIGTHLYFLIGYRTAGELSTTMSRVHVFDTAASRDA